MARTINHMPYDVQVRLSWGDTDPTPYIDPLTGDEWDRGFWKGPRADRHAKGVGSLEHVPGARIGGSNPSAHREYLGRPRFIPTPADFEGDDAAEEAFLAEQRWLDEMSDDLFAQADDDGSFEEDYPDYVECYTCGGPCIL